MKIEKPKCGLCGKSKNLIKTPCCDEWICDDQHKYVAFSYAKNSCSRNHDRYTLCSFHHNEGHPGTWQDCKKCRKDFEPEMVTYFGTNEYNFKKMENPPEHKPTHCSRCSCIIKLGEGGYTLSNDKYFCDKCQPLPYLGLS